MKMSALSKSADQDKQENARNNTSLANKTRKLFISCFRKQMRDIIGSMANIHCTCIIYCMFYHNIMLALIDTTDVLPGFFSE